jgi:hypothetical protein
LLLQCARVSGLRLGLSRQLRPWRAPRSVHDPGKTILDLAISIALGGDCLADAAVVRAQPELFGVVASDPTISRLIDALGDEPALAIAAIRRARGGRTRGGVATVLAGFCHWGGGHRPGCHLDRGTLRERGRNPRTSSVDSDFTR